MPIIYYSDKESIPSDFVDVAKEVTEDGDNKGKFAVNVVARAKLEEFRDNNTKLATKLDETTSSFGAILAAIGVKAEDFDIADFKDSYEELKKTAQKVADGKITAPEDIEKTVAERMEIARGKYEKQVSEAAQRESAMKAERDEAVKNYKRTFIDRAVAEAFTDPDLGVQMSALSDVMQKAYGAFIVEEDNSLTCKKDGVKQFGEDGITGRTVKEWITVDLRKEAPHYFKASQGGGAGGGGDTKQFGGMTEAEFNKLPASKRLEIANQMKFKSSSKR